MHGNKFQLEACLLKDNRGYVSLSFVSKNARAWHASVPLDGVVQAVM